MSGHFSRFPADNAAVQRALLNGVDAQRRFPGRATQAVVDGNGKGAVMRLVDMSVGQCAGNAGRRPAMDAL